MPKGVVWRHGTCSSRSAAASTSSRASGRGARGLRRAGQEEGFALTFLPIAPLMHGATQWAVMGQSFVGNKVVLGPVRPPRGVAPRRGKGQLADDDGRRHGPAARRGARRGAEQDPRPVVAHLAVVDGRRVLPLAQGPVPRPLPQPGDDRCHRLVRRRRQRHHRGREGQDRDEGRPDRRPCRHRGARRPDAPVEPGSGGSAGWPAPATSPRLLQRPGEDRGDVRRGRRHPLRDPRRPRPGRGRRIGDAARPGFAVDQLGRREDLPGGGRDRGKSHPAVYDAVVVASPTSAGASVSPPSCSPATARARPRDRAGPLSHQVAGYKVPRELTS